MLDNEKREKFKDMLLSLAKEQDLQSNITGLCSDLEDIYCDEGSSEHFRHFYSDVFEVLASLKKGIKPGAGDILGENIRILYEQYRPTTSNRDISKELRKLYDHVSLDIARMNYSDRGDKELENKPAIKALKEIEPGINLSKSFSKRL